MRAVGRATRATPWGGSGAVRSTGSDATTSLQRTYRYLRLAIAGAVVAFVAFTNINMVFGLPILAWAIAYSLLLRHFVPEVREVVAVG